MTRVTQNGDLKIERKRVHERKAHLGTFVNYDYFNPNLAPNGRSYGSEYNDVITCRRSLMGYLFVDQVRLLL